MIGHIYLIREREFINSEKSIVKLGKSGCVLNRVAQYPKNSEIIAILEVSNFDEAEKELKIEFNKIFCQRKDIGIEYFEGNKKEMISVMTYVAEKYSDFNNINLTDKNIYNNYKKYVEENIKKDIGGKIKWTTLKRKYCDWHKRNIITRQNCFWTGE